MYLRKGWDLKNLNVTKWADFNETGKPELLNSTEFSLPAEVAFPSPPYGGYFLLARRTCFSNGDFITIDC